MAVIGIARPQAQLFKQAIAQIQFAADIETILPHANGHRRFLFAAIAMCMPTAGAGRDAVIGVINAVGQAHIAAIVDEGDPARCCPAFHRAVGNAAALVGQFKRFGGLVEIAFAGFFRREIQHLGAQARRKDVAAGAQIVAVAIAAIQMDDDPVRHRHINRCPAGPIVRRAAIARKRIDMDGFIGDRTRNALVERVDRAANGLAAK